ncbi:MAG: endonuclease/exonuclease/phosphatase family protein [Planctomycetota bacterium]
MGLDADARDGVKTGNTPHAKRPSCVRWAALLVLDVCALGATLACAAWLLGDRFWLFDLAASFTPQAAAGAAALALVLLVLRRWVRAGVCAAACGVALLAFVPGRVLLPGEPLEESDRVRVLVANVLGRNAEADALLGVIDREKPDVVIVLETGLPLVEALRDPGAAPALPHRFIADRAGPGFMVLLSRWPQRAQRPGDPDDPAQWAGGPAATATALGRVALIERPGGAFLMFGVHPDSPHRFDRWIGGNRRMRDVLARREQILAFDPDLPSLIAGDLNATPASVRTRLARDADLRRAKPLLAPLRTGNLGGTWPAYAPGVLRVAIDGALIDRNTRVLAWHTVELRGSDHLGVVIDLEIPRD